MFVFRSSSTEVLFPDDREEEWASAVHNSDVRHSPIAVIGLEDVDRAEEERMLGDGTHCIVTYSCRDGTSYPGWVGEKRIETAVTAVVEIDVDSAIESEDEVADGVCALDGEGVVIEGVDEPGVFFLDEFS
jgi:hypothetical protein